MIIEGFPLYCGGRILKGLWDPRMEKFDRDQGKYIYQSDEAICLNSTKFQRMYYDRLPSTGTWDNINDVCTGNKYFPNLCSTVQLNQSLLWELLTGHMWIGTIVAVTNRQQRKGDEFLTATGFKMVADVSKLGPDMGGLCKTWVGDFHKDVKPILIEAPKLAKQWSNM